MCRIFLLCLVFMISAGFALPEAEIRHNNQNVFQNKQTRSLSNISNWAYWIAYDGLSAYNPVLNKAGGIYPRGTANAIFQDGIIWGAYVRDSLNVNPRVGGQNYNVATTPGKIITPGTYPWGAASAVPELASDPRVRLYRIDNRFTVPWDQLTPDQQSDAEELLRQDVAENRSVDPSQVTVYQIAAMVNILAQDWVEWPTDRGAPLNTDGTPGIAYADQVIWFVCNDLYYGYFYWPPPLGIELQVTFWAYNQPSAPLNNVIFKRYQILNKSGCRFDSMYVGQWSDLDIGSPNDDFVGCDTLLQLGYGYNAFSEDSRYQSFGLVPPAAGYTLMYGPVVPSPGDTAIYNLNKLPDYRNLPLTSFTYSAAGSILSDPHYFFYDNLRRWYKMLKGYVPNNDDLYDLVQYIIGSGPGTGEPTFFPLAGDPVSGYGDVDGQGTNFRAGDRRILMSSGPFYMEPGDTQEVVFAVVGGLGSDNINSVNRLKENVFAAHSALGQPLRVPRGSVKVSYPDYSRSAFFCRMDLGAFAGVISAEALFQPQEGQEASFSLPLYDDGQHGDSLAGDGLWRNESVVSNRQYPYMVELALEGMAGPDSFPAVVGRIPLRPAPVLTDWQVIWENGRQDHRLNSGETAHIGFTLNNPDEVNGLGKFTIQTGDYVGSYSGGIAPGGEVQAESLYVIVKAPDNGDSVQIKFNITYDGQKERRSINYPVTAWTPPQGWQDRLVVEALRGSAVNVDAIIADRSLLKEHDYLLTFYAGTDSSDLRWRLVDESTGEIKVDDARPAMEVYHPHPVVDGIEFQVWSWDSRNNPNYPFRSFEVVANGAGALDPPEMGCLAFNNNGFPILVNGRYPKGTDRPTRGVQQSSNESAWVIHTGMTAANDGSFAYFLERVMRNDDATRFISHDFEMRFTERGGLAVWAFELGGIYPVPFELWNIGVDTPYDPSDDFRMIPWILNDTGDEAEGDTVYNINADDHIVSPGDNDPYMDWVYWYEPSDKTPGESGYNLFLSKGDFGNEVMARIVLVNWDGGDVNDPSFPANLDAVMPETGTVFRIVSNKPNQPGDSLLVQVSEDRLLPASFKLYPNYPNPFNSGTTFRIDLSRPVKVKLEIFNVLGQRVKLLADRQMEEGIQRLYWDGRNEAGHDLASCLYFYRVKAGDYVKTRKMILLR